MSFDKLIELEQPLTHTSQKGICEKMCIEKYQLSRTQLLQFYDLKRQSNILYSGRPEEVEKIRNLYRIYFKKDINQDFTSRDWLQLGFQGDRPDRDLRGGGVMALDLIIYYLQKERVNVDDMKKDQNDFFFAVTAINIAFFMKKFFHLADHLLPDIDRLQYCNRPSLKNFCGMLCQQKNCYFQLHRCFLSYFYLGIWKRGKKKSLLNFNQSFDELKQKIMNSFNVDQNLQLVSVLNDFKVRL